MDKDFSKQIKKYKLTTLGFFVILVGFSIDVIMGKGPSNVILKFLNFFIIFMGIGFVVFGYRSRIFLEEYFNENEGKENEYLSFSFLGKLQRIAIVPIGLLITYSAYRNNTDTYIFPVVFTMSLLLAVVILPIFFKPSENYGEFEKNISLKAKSVAFGVTIFILSVAIILFKISPSFLNYVVQAFHNNIIDMMSYLIYAGVALGIMVGDFYTWLKYR